MDNQTILKLYQKQKPEDSHVTLVSVGPDPDFGSRRICMTFQSDITKHTTSVSVVSSPESYETITTDRYVMDAYHKASTILAAGG